MLFFAILLQVLMANLVDKVKLDRVVPQVIFLWLSSRHLS